ncbi:hypothetical protein [Kocuria rosea]|uniref:hypothetical protein n=1 Tax=Kocuria rosea TaxID=1275 RepID=UPI00203B60B7|nr:hypothetical protein [Kocuria rosea]MCM3687835.1 hypothetical protein [Kocuria rosea]
MNHNISPNPARGRHSIAKNTVFNTSLYGASTAVGLTILAAEQLHARHVDPTGDALELMAQVLRKVLRRVEHQGATDISSVLSERTDLMALLHTRLEREPVPLDTHDADVAGIQEWVDKTVSWMLHMVRVSQGVALEALRGPQTADPEFYLAHVVSGVDPRADDDA